MPSRNTILAGAFAALAAPVILFAQTDPAPPPTTPLASATTFPDRIAPNRGLGGGNTNSDAAVLDAMKKNLLSTDEEWKVIGPALQKVLSAQRVVDAGTIADTSEIPVGMVVMQMFGGPGGNRNSFSGPGGGAGGGRGGPRPEGGPPNNATTQPGGAAPDGGGPPGGPGGQGGPGGGGGGPGGRRPRFGGGGMGMGTNAVTLAISELKTAIADPKSTPDLIKEKAAAVTTARTKAKEILAAAEKTLIDLLTTDQEATLAALGVID